MIKHLFNPLKNKQGVALLSVMLVFSVMSIMLGGMTVYSTSHLQRSDANTQTVAAYYAAEAGLNYETERFTAIINNAKDEGHSFAQLQTALSTYIAANHNKEIDFDSNNINATVAIRKEEPGLDDMEVYRITSTGLVNGQERVVSRDIMFKYVPGGTDPGNGFKLDKAVLSQTTIKLEGSAKVKGIVGTYSNTPGAVNINNSAGHRVSGVQIPETMNERYKDVVIITRNNVPLKDVDYSSYINGGIGSITKIENVFEYPPIVMPNNTNEEDVNKLPRLPEFVDKTGPNTWDKDIIRVGAAGLYLNQSGGVWSSDYTYPFPSSNQPQMYYVPQFNIGNNARFSVNVGNNDITLIVDSFIIKGPVQVIGTGSLTIIVRGNTVSNPIRSTDSAPRFLYNYGGGNGYIGHLNPNQFKLYFEDIYVEQGNGGNRKTVAATWTIGGSSNVYASIMASNMSFNVTGSGRLTGNLITNGSSIIIDGGSTDNNAYVYYAPNGHITFSGSGKLYGAVIANSFLASGSGTVEFVEVNIENFPFSVFDPVTGGGSGSVSTQFKLVEGPTFEHNK